MEMINSITAFIIGYVGMVFCIVGYYRLKRYLRLAKEKREAIHNVKTDLREKRLTREKAKEYIKIIRKSDMKTLIKFNIHWLDREQRELMG